MAKDTLFLGYSQIGRATFKEVFYRAEARVGAGLVRYAEQPETPSNNTDDFMESIADCFSGYNNQFFSEFSIQDDCQQAPGSTIEDAMKSFLDNLLTAVGTNEHADPKVGVLLYFVKRKNMNALGHPLVPTLLFKIKPIRFMVSQNTIPTELILQTRVPPEPGGD